MEVSRARRRRVAENAVEVAAEMVDGLEHQGRIVGGLGQHERALEHRLGVSSQAGRADLGFAGAGGQGGGEVRFDSVGVTEDARRTRVSHRRVGLEGLWVMVPTRQVYSAGSPVISDARKSRYPDTRSTGSSASWYGAPANKAPVVSDQYSAAATARASLDAK